MENLVYQMVMMIVAAAVLAAVLYIVYKSWRNGISPMPASAAVRHAVVRVMKQRASRGVMVEAGSGWGTLALQIAESCKGWRVIGIENSVIPMWISFWRRGLVIIPMYRSKGLIYTHIHTGVWIRLCVIFIRERCSG